jgi:pimeloyl-ACP methyl ester carboxylesterase
MRNAPQTILDASGETTSFLSAGAGTPIVLLHGIGGGAASWHRQLDGVSASNLVIAWDAPGYGQSSPLPGAQSRSALAYGQRMWRWLDALNLTQPISLVAQSLGCIMAAAAASLQPNRVAQLTLLSPALGYGKSAPQVRETKRDERIKNVESLGMAALAEKRAAAMLAPNAASEKIQSVRETMAAIPAAGYIAATHLLVESDLKTLLENLSMPITIAAGRSDTITPYAQCKAFASEMKCLFVTLEDAGHASPTDVPALVNALIASLPSTNVLGAQV